MAKILIENKAPGKESLAKAKSLDELKAWFDRHGQEYLRLVRGPAPEK